MTFIIIGIVLICILFAVVMLVFEPKDYGAKITRYRKIGHDNDETDSAAETRWRSVRLRPGLIACESIADLDGQVFLSREAPELPLANCTMANCRCHYVFLDDRRSGIDRRADLERLGNKISINGRDRRHSTGRRGGDLSTA